MTKCKLLMYISCFIILCMCSCSNNEKNTDISSYGNFNEYVRRDLEKSIALLPKTIPSDATVDNYIYSYSCAPLGDPNYSILLCLRFSDENSFGFEKNRIVELIGENVTITNSEGKEWYYWGETKVGLEQLNNTEIHDGLFVRITYAMIDYENRQIIYAVGVLVDGSTYDDDIIDIGCRGL